MRSLTEYFTNHTVLSSAELAQALPRLIDPHEALPQSVLPTFLHEATHHWCFSSAVGTTIALLSVRARLRGLRAIATSSTRERENLERAAAEDLTRVEVTRELMRPLSEGIATFAEFDVLPTIRAPAVAAPLRWAIQVCNRSLLTEGTSQRDWVTLRNEATMRTAVALSTSRQDWSVRNRRVDILQQPLSCSNLPEGHASRGKEGYLAGYLAVKNLWCNARNLHEYLAFADYYMLFLYDYFYEDDELVRLLLDDSALAPESLAPITFYMRDRLLEPLDEDRVKDFHRRMMAVRSNAHSSNSLHFPSHPNDNRPSAQTEQLWERVIGDEMRVPCADYALFAKGLMYGRELMSLGSVPVEASVTKGEAVLTLPQGEALRLHVDADAPLGRFAATLNLCIGTRSGYHVVYALNNQFYVKHQAAIIAMQAMPALSDEQLRVVRRAALGRETPVVLDQLMRLEQQPLEGLRELSRVPGYLSQTTELLDGMYEPRALLSVPEQVLEEAIVKMRSDGVYGLLDEREDLIRAIAIHACPDKGKRRGFDRLREPRDLSLFARGARDLVRGIPGRVHARRRRTASVRDDPAGQGAHEARRERQVPGAHSQARRAAPVARHDRRGRDRIRRTAGGRDASVLRVGGDSRRTRRLLRMVRQGARGHHGRDPRTGARLRQLDEA